MTLEDSVYKSIGDVSKIVGVPSHVLRFWEKKFSSLNPKKRRGHRYYKEKDIELAKQIKELLYEKKYTVEGAVKYLKENKAISVSKDPLEKPKDADEDFSEVIDELEKIRKLLLSS